MRFIATLAICLSASAMPAAAQEAFRQKVGGWSVGGSNGDCSAGFGSGGTMLLLVSPASGGENSGAIVIGNGSWKLKDEQVLVELKGSGPWARAWNSHASNDILGYWMPFGTASEADQFPDNFLLDAYVGTRQIANIPVTGYKAALAALRQCASETIKR